MSSYSGVPLEVIADNSLPIIDEEGDIDDVFLENAQENKPRRRRICLALCAIFLVILFTFSVFSLGYGAGFGSGFATEDKRCSNDEFSSSSSDSSNEDEDDGFDFCHMFTINDFNSEPLPDIDNIFLNVTFPASFESEWEEGEEWEEGVYHPLLPESESPPFVYRYSTDYIPDRNDPIQSFVQETIEYQIRVGQEEFQHKQEALDVLLRIVGQFLEPYISILEEPKETWYYELQYKKRCGGDYSEFRSRSYITGSKAGFSEIAINKDYDTKIEGMQTPSFLPAVGKNDFEMKLEQDVHPCKHKYNRKLTLKKQEYDLVFDCQSCEAYFPRIFSDESLFEENAMEIHSNKTWWAYSQSGYLFGNTTRFKFSCNIAYEDETMEDILNEVAIPNHSSEWSVRIYSFDEGYNVWDEYVLATMGEFYTFLLENYGSYHEDPNDC